MKKTILAVLTGVLFGIMLMVGIFSVLNMKPSNEDMYAQIYQDDKVDHTKVDLPVKSETEETEDTTEDMETQEVETEEVETETEEKEAEEVETETEEKETEEVETETEEKETQEVEAVQPTPPVQKPYYIKVNRQANCVTVYTYDESGNYTVPVKAMTCSVGLDNKTPLGVSKISDKYNWRLLFGNVYGHYAIRFNGHIMFHSVPYMTPSNDTLKEGEFNLLGQPASLGCVRLCVADVKWIYDNCGKGTIVEVYDSPDPGPLGKPEMPKIDENSPYKNWDPTDPNPANPWLQG